MGDFDQRLLRWTGVFAAAMSFGVVAWLVSAGWSFTTDDAYISLRYAKNLVDGAGLVWNPGQAPVEGYSNFSFVLLGAAAGFAGVSPVLAIKLAGLVGLIGTLIALWSIGRIWLTPAGATIAPMVLLSYYGTFFWATSGLETALYQCLVATSFALVLSALYERGGGLRERPRKRLMAAASGVLFVAALTRPEAPALAGIFAALLAFHAWRTPALRKELLRSACWLLLPLGTLLVAYYAWKWSHFGALLPNSFACKLESSKRPLKLDKAYFRIAAAPLLLFLASRFWRTAPGLALVAPSLLYFALLYGSDPVIAHENRLTLPVYGLLLVAGAAAGLSTLARLTRLPSARLELGAVILAAAALLSGAPHHAREFADYADKYSRRMEARARTGAWLREAGGPNATYVVGDAGMISLTAGGTSVDAFCLNNRAMTQQPHGRDPQRFAAHVLEELKPDFIVMANQLPDQLAPRPGYGIFPAITARPDFSAYELARVESAQEGDPFHYFVFRRSEKAKNAPQPVAEELGGGAQ